jgi:hypothetical protein
LVSVFAAFFVHSGAMGHGSFVWWWAVRGFMANFPLLIDLPLSAKMQLELVGGVWAGATIRVGAGFEVGVGLGLGLWLWLW